MFVWFLSEAEAPRSKSELTGAKRGILVIIPFVVYIYILSSSLLAARKEKKRGKELSEEKDERKRRKKGRG